MRFRIAHCLAIFPLLASAVACTESYQVGDVELIDVTDETKAALAVQTAFRNMGGLNLGGISAEDIEKKLKANGFSTKIDPYANGQYISVGGVHGKKLNTLFQLTTFSKKVVATLTRDVDLGNSQIESSSGRVSIETYGNNIGVLYDTVEFGKNYAQGPAWKTIAAMIKDNYGLPDFTGFPEEISGQVRFGFSFDENGKKTKDGVISVSVTVTACQSPREKRDLLFYKPTVGDKVMYGNHVCELDITYFDKRRHDWLEAASRSLREAYTKKFGQPDCWAHKDGCIKLESKDSSKLFDKQQALINEIIAKK